MSIEDKVYLNLHAAIDRFIRMGFDMVSPRKLVSNDLEVTIEPIDNNTWRSSVEKLTCRPVQNKLQNPAPVDNAAEEFTQKVEVSCVEQMKEPTAMPVNKP